MPLALEKRLALVAEASNLMLAGSLQAYGRNSKVAMRVPARNRKDSPSLKRALRTVVR